MKLPHVAVMGDDKLCLSLRRVFFQVEVWAAITETYAQSSVQMPVH